MTDISGEWVVYMLECADGTLYTGVTNNLQNRLEKHEDGTGAKYTRGRGPFILRLVEVYDTKGDALKRENEIKGLSRFAKLTLTNSAQNPI